MTALAAFVLVREEPTDPYNDEGNLLLLLTAVWSLQTGRPCPEWPASGADPARLVEFWADPEME
ncbi:hypothetical protein [Actinocorallia longicatena]|uniref:Uncharacterized protein n=1 Tax=Actinocorallia longicatena TaxID=111803 RepID=A0ABP6QDQ6_9ACTN